MGLSITNNVASLTAQNNLNRTASMLGKSLERLSSGLKINRGADGPAALVISEEQRAQILNAIFDLSRAEIVSRVEEGGLNKSALFAYDYVYDIAAGLGEARHATLVS